MALSPFENECDRIYGEILEKLQRKDDENLRFAPVGTAAEVLRGDNLSLFFRSLLSSLPASQRPRISEGEFACRVEDRALYAFIAILILASCGIDAARKLVERLVVRNDWPVRDSQGRSFGALPAEKDDCWQLFGDWNAVDKFLSKQPYFSTIVLRKREEVKIANPKGLRFPYLEERELAKGSFGEVFAVKIAKGHFFNPRTGKPNDEPIWLARKDYILRSGAQDEREIMQLIMDNQTRNRNILENFGSLEIGTSTYSLFMPRAICDLRRYMVEVNSTRPTNAINRANFKRKANIIRCAAGLAGGLAFLHGGIKSTGFEQLVFYHMDLKPSNILVFNEGEGDQKADIWKLSDFGMSRVKFRRRDQEESPEKNFDRRFVRRTRKAADPSVSATLNRRGEGTYLAPESISSTASMTAESDVWSLGCVISVVFSYLEFGGAEGVEAYSEIRANQAHADGMDRFFLPSSGFSPTQLNPEVKKWHTRLIYAAQLRSAEEGAAVKAILRYLEDNVLAIKQQSRREKAGARAIEAELERACVAYEKLANVVGDTSLPSSPSNDLKASVRGTKLDKFVEPLRR